MTGIANDNARSGMPIDLEYCMRMFGGDRKVVARLVGDFLRMLEMHRKEIARSIDAADLERLKKEAHSIKGGAAVLSARPIMELAAGIEELAGSGRLGEAEEAAARLGGEVDRLVGFCQDFLDG